MKAHILIIHNDDYPTGCKDLTIGDCRKIFEAAGYGLELGGHGWGWQITCEVKGAYIRQAYYDPLPIKLRSRTFKKADIQAFAMMIKLEEVQDE